VHEVRLLRRAPIFWSSGTQAMRLLCRFVCAPLPELLGAAVVAGRAALPELLETAGAKKRFMAPRCKQNLEPILSSRGEKLTNSL